MKLSFEEIMKGSFVVTIDNERFNVFQKVFSENNIPLKLFPKRLIGYEISDNYLIDSFKIISDLQFSEIRGLLEKNLNLIHAICNNASHFAIVQYAMLFNLPFVTIFEDDAVPVKDCIEKLNDYCSNVPDDTDILRLGYLQTDEIYERNYVPPKIINEHFIVQRFPGSHAYIVFKKFFKRFLEINKYEPRCDYSKINPTSDKVVYALKESLFKQRNILNRPVIHSWKLDNGKIKLPPVH